MIKEKIAPLMQFVCTRQRLHQALSIVTRAVCKSRINIEKMPLLGYIRMETKDNELRLSATDLDISLTVRIDLFACQEEFHLGVVAVPAQLFAGIISKMADGQVQITVGQDLKLNLLHARGKASLTCLSAEMYMPIPGAQEGEQEVVLPVGPLKEVVREVAVAVARDDAFPVLTCLLIHVENKQMVFAATDRFRTAHRVLPVAEEEVRCDLLVPSRALGELVSVLPADGMVTMSVTPNGGQVLFHTQWLTFSSRLLEGSFPNYTAAIPKDRQTRITVKTEEFKEIVNLTAPYANAGTAGLISLCIKGSQGMEAGSLTVASEETEMGDGENTIPAVVEGEDQEEINFNCRFLLDALSVVSTPETCLEIGIMRIKSGEGTQISAKAGVLKAVRPHPCLHSFLALSTGL